MFKIACLFLLVAIANAQLWPWPQPQPEIQPIPPLVEINPPNLTPRPRPPIVNEEENRPGAGHKNKCPSVNGRQATIFPHESNCHQFYICNDGFACKKLHFYNSSAIKCLIFF